MRLLDRVTEFLFGPIDLSHVGKEVPSTASAVECGGSGPLRSGVVFDDRPHVVPFRGDATRPLHFDVTITTCLPRETIERELQRCLDLWFANPAVR